MALPSLDKTWQFDVNQSCGHATDNWRACQDTLYKLKQSLIGFALNPWVVRSSCAVISNVVVGLSAGNDYVDHWTASNRIEARLPTPTTNKHSWIVLEQTGVGANYNVCIDMSENGILYRWGAVGISQAGYNGDGTGSSRPTAPDEVLVHYGDWTTNGGFLGMLHVMQSTDGECSRIAVCRANGTDSLWLFDKAKNPVTGWTDPGIGVVVGSGGPVYDQLQYSTKVGGYRAGQMKMYVSGEGYYQRPVGYQLTAPDDHTGEWYISPMGLVCPDAGNRGRRGEVFDMWWGDRTVADGLTYPGDGSNAFVQFGDIILPWNGTVPLIG